MMKTIFRILTLLFVLVSVNGFTQNASLYWNLANANYVSGEYTFDVEFRSSDAETYMNAGALKISYNQNAFAEPVVADVTINSAFSSGFWLPTITIEEGIIIVSTFDLFNAGYLIPQEPDNYLNYCSITLNVTNPCEVVGVSFIQSDMDNQSTYVGTPTSLVYVNNYVNDWSNQNLGYVPPITTTWTGNTDSDWLDASNWSDGFPCTGSVVTIPDATNYPIMDVNGFCDGVTITDGALTVNEGATLDVTGDFAIESTGSFIDNGTLTVGGNTTVECNMTAGQWHGFSAPVTGLTSNDLYLGGTPDVWMMYYDQSAAVGDKWNDVTSLSQSLGDMNGWMIQVGGATAQQYSFNGNLRKSSSVDVTATGDNFNFIGNPFPSAIDWDAVTVPSGINDAVYVWNNGNWDTYISGTGTPGTFNGDIAMNQGFFVEATGNTTFNLTNDVCTHSDVLFKNTNNSGQIVRLHLNSGDETDESVIRYIDGATVGFDGNFDARKMISFNENYPQIFSTANNNMAINSLPLGYGEPIAMDVTGENGVEMTISLTEANDFAEVYLKDEFTGAITDLKLSDYTFNYNSDIENRFNVFFSITDINENNDIAVNVFSYNHDIMVNLDGQSIANVTVYNLLGQTITSVVASGTQTVIPVNETGYYVVKVSNAEGIVSEKVFIK